MRAYRAVVPLAILLLLVGILVTGTALIRELIGRAGFLAEREAILAVWLAGLLIGATTFGWVARRTLRTADSALSLWILAATAGVLASPLLLILLQDPSP
jgi:hypothetical protein